MRNHHEKHAELLERQIIEGHQRDGRHALTIYRDADHLIIKVSPGASETFEPFLMKLEHEILKDGCSWFLTLEDLQAQT